MRGCAARMKTRDLSRQARAAGGDRARRLQRHLRHSIVEFCPGPPSLQAGSFMRDGPGLSPHRRQGQQAQRPACDGPHRADATVVSRLAPRSAGHRGRGPPCLHRLARFVPGGRRVAGRRVFVGRGIEQRPPHHLRPVTGAPDSPTARSSSFPFAPAIPTINLYDHRSTPCAVDKGRGGVEVSGRGKGQQSGAGVAAPRPHRATRRPGGIALEQIPGRRACPRPRRSAERGVVFSPHGGGYPSTTRPTTRIEPRWTGVELRARMASWAITSLERASGRAWISPRRARCSYAWPPLRAPTLHDRAQRRRARHRSGHRLALAPGAASLDRNLPFFERLQALRSRRSYRAPGVEGRLGALGYPLDRQGEWALLPKRLLKDAMVADVAGHVLRARLRPDLPLLFAVPPRRHAISTYGAALAGGLLGHRVHRSTRIGQVLGALPGGALEADIGGGGWSSDHGFLAADARDPRHRPPPPAGSPGTWMRRGA